MWWLVFCVVGFWFFGVVGFVGVGCCDVFDVVVFGGWYYVGVVGWCGFCLCVFVFLCLVLCGVGYFCGVGVYCVVDGLYVCDCVYELFFVVFVVV